MMAIELRLRHLAIKLIGGFMLVLVDCPHSGMKMLDWYSVAMIPKLCQLLRYMRSERSIAQASSRTVQRRHQLGRTSAAIRQPYTRHAEV